MLAKSQFILLLVITALFIALTGCAGVSVSNPITPVDNQTVAVQLQYVDGSKVGPLYNTSVNVPQEWVGHFETRNLGNKVYFDYINQSGSPAQIFFVEALSPFQYWKQSGSHPGAYTNIINRGDTYFIYYLPIDTYHSGLPDEEFATLTEAIPGIISSFTAEAAN